MELFEENYEKKGIPKEYYKFSTHPIWQDRFDIINSKNQKKIYNYDQKLNNEFNSVKAKLFGFTENNFEKLNKYLKKDDLTYAQSILYSKKGNIKKSLILLNNLNQKNINNVYLLETKADILYASGFLKEAILFYEKCLTENKENIYVKKRIFDIKYTLNIYDSSKEFFEQNSFLLLIFVDKELMRKFELLANLNNDTDWVNYFSIIKNDFDRKYAIRELNKINNKTNDKMLKRVIFQILKRLK